MVDVTLTTQGKFLKAHRMVLGACSPYFQVWLKLEIFWENNTYVIVFCKFQEIFDRHDTTPHPIIIMNGKQTIIYFSQTQC